MCVCVSVYVSGLADASLTLTGCRYWSVSLFQTVCLFSSLGIHEIHSLSFVLSLSLQWRERLANSIASFPSIASVSHRFASHRRTSFNPEISLRRHLRSPAYLINIYFSRPASAVKYEFYLMMIKGFGSPLSIFVFHYSIYPTPYRAGHQILGNAFQIDSVCAWERENEKIKIREGFSLGLAVVLWTLFELCHFKCQALANIFTTERREELSSKERPACSYKASCDPPFPGSLWNQYIVMLRCDEQLAALRISVPASQLYLESWPLRL